MSILLLNKLNKLLGVFDKQSKVYPTMANAPTLTAGVGAWVLGNFTEIVPVNTITSPYKIDYISFAAFTGASTHEVILYKGLGGSEIEIGRVRVHPGATTNTVIGVPIYTKTLNANERISAKCAGAAGGTSVNTSIMYHILD